MYLELSCIDSYGKMFVKRSMTAGEICCYGVVRKNRAKLDGVSFFL